MSRSTLAAFLIISCLFLPLNAAEKTEAKAPDGEWAVDVKPAATNKLKGTMQAYKDVITIKDGKFSTQINTKYGFEPAACTVKSENGKTVVSAELKDEKHGSNKYELMFKDNTVEGTMHWGKMGEDGKPKNAEYAISGTKK